MKTIEQTVAARPSQIVLAAPNGCVGRVPRQHVPVLAKPGPVVMPNNRGTFATLGPCAARRIAPGGGIQAAWVRTGQNIVPIRLVTARIDDVSALVQTRRFIDEVVAGMKVADIVGDDDPLRVVPRTVTNSVTSIDSWNDLGVATRAVDFWADT